MGIIERKQKETDIKMNDIIDCAERIFNKKSVNNATMDDLSIESEYTKKTIYKYFKNKEEIYKSILYRAFRLFNEIIEENVILKENKDAQEKLISYSRSSIIFFKKNSFYYELISNYKNEMEDFDNQSEITRNCYREGDKTFKYLLEIIKEGISENLFRKDIDPIDIAISLWGFSQGILSLTNVKSNYLQKTFNKSTEEIIENSFKLIIKALENN